MKEALSLSLVALLFAAWPAAAMSPHRLLLPFDEVRIEAVYPSMAGPAQNRWVNLEHNEALWITGFEVSVADNHGNEVRDDFLCHVNLQIFDPDRRVSEMRSFRPRLSLSAGQERIDFPRGFALRIKGDGSRRVSVNFMALNRRADLIGEHVRTKVMVDYFTDQEAQKLSLKPLREETASTLCLVDGDDAEEDHCLPAEPKAAALRDAQGRIKTGHWLVPPGKHVWRTRVLWASGQPLRGKVHYISMHVHPYARAVELWDITGNTPLWRGKVHTDTDGRILDMERFSSVEGLKIEPDHDYELRTFYDNTTNHPIDAMAALFLYMEDFI